jgi:hypothetical protein
MLMGMSVKMGTMRMRRKKHRKPMMYQCRMWRTEGTNNVDGYEGEAGDNVDEEEEASQADNGSTQNVGH